MRKLQLLLLCSLAALRIPSWGICDLACRGAKPEVANSVRCNLCSAVGSTEEAEVLGGSQEPEHSPAVFSLEARQL